MAFLSTVGLDPSFTHPRNGMTLVDMEAIGLVATALNEIIIFRSTGPWSLPWITRNFPTKSFHVKGKSSDWGPMAGFVPYRSEFSKKGGKAGDEVSGIKANNDGIAHHHFRKLQLRLTKEWLLELASVGRNLDEIEKGDSTVCAIRTLMAVECPAALAPADASGSNAAYLLTGAREFDGLVCDFLALPSEDPTPPARARTAALRLPRAFGIYFSPPAGFDGNRDLGQGKRPLPVDGPAVSFAGKEWFPLEVMVPPEAWGTDLPMTGDYDMWSVCPRKEAYGAGFARVVPTDQEGRPLSAEGVDYTLVERDPLGISIFNIPNWSYTNLDAPLDNTLANTWGGGWSRRFVEPTKTERTEAVSTISTWALKNDGSYERTGSAVVADQRPNILKAGGSESTKDGFGIGGAWEDMHLGNLTPRILRAMVEMNKAMANQGERREFRRVHHNAESHRPFGAANQEQLRGYVDGRPTGKYGDGFPLTVFQPNSPDIRKSGRLAISGQCQVFTIDTLDELLCYYDVLNQEGWYIPRNQAWGIGHLRDLVVAPRFGIYRDPSQRLFM